MPTVRRKVKLHPVQQAFRRSDALFRAFVGGRGAGKSWVGAYDLLRRVRPGRSYLIGSPTGVLMQDTTYPTFKQLARDVLGVWGGVKLTPYPTARILLDGGEAEIRFRTAEDPEKMRGPNLSGAWLDEASLMREEAHKVVIGCLRELGRMGWLTATFTPKGPTHWTFEAFATGKPDTALFRAPTQANPFNPPEFAATMRGQYGETQYARQEVGGEFVQIEGAEWAADLIDRKDRWFTDWPETASRVVSNDPSKGAREDADYQAFADVRLDGNGIIWCDVDADKQGVQAMVERGLTLCRVGPPVAAFAVEDNDGLGMLVTEYRRLAAARGMLVNIVPVRNTVNKVFRLRRLGGYLSEIDERYGPKLRIRDTKGGRLLAAQMKDFPLGEHDDCLDALELAIRVHEEPYQGGRRR